MGFIRINSFLNNSTYPICLIKGKIQKNNDVKYDPFLTYVKPGTILDTGPSTYDNESHPILQSPNQLQQAVKEKKFFLNLYQNSNISLPFSDL